MDLLQLDLFAAPAPRQERTGALRSFHVQAQPVGVAQALAGERKARGQEAIVLAFFRANASKRFTPSEAHWWLTTERSLLDPRTPATSIRRAITNLTTRGLLIHHAKDRRPGPLGSPESTWSLRE